MKSLVRNLRMFAKHPAKELAWLLPRSVVYWVVVRAACNVERDKWPGYTTAVQMMGEFGPQPGSDEPGTLMACQKRAALEAISPSASQIQEQFSRLFSVDAVKSAPKLEEKL